MNRKSITKIISVVYLFAIIASLSGCSFNSVSADELRTIYPEAIENSLKEELYYWKETVNTSYYTSYCTCNVYAEIDKNYNLIRDEDGKLANVKIDVDEKRNSNAVYKALCGKSQSSKSAETKNYLFETEYKSPTDKPVYRKTEITPQDFIKSEKFNDIYSLSAKLREFSELTIDDMNFDIDNKLMKHTGKVVKFSFAVKPEYLERYKKEHGKDSLFAGSKYATIELAYNRFASIVIYSSEQLSGNISIDKEAYKLESVYYGPIVNVPSYDSADWKDK